MQRLSWYVRRLQAMSAHEIAWRARSTIRNVTDRYRVGLRLYPRALAEARRVSVAADAPRWCPVPRGDWVPISADDPASAWRDRLVSSADRIAAHRLSFFDLGDVSLGNPIDWNREHAAGRATPMSFAAGIDYRDHGVTGDAKVAWEPNRHHQLVVLGRAYRATGDAKYAAAVVEQIESWIAQNPFGYGMNWRSPLEVAIRVINWTWAIDLIADSGAFTKAFEDRLLQSVALHVWDIARKYSRGSSANNRRIGEACGVFVATSYFPAIADAARLRLDAHRILSEEIEAQTYASGATREQAFGYHLFVLQFFVVAGFVARRTSLDFPAAFWSRLVRMFAFAGALAEGGPPPFYGDADDGYVLDLGDRASDVAAWMAVGAALVGGGATTINAEAAEVAQQILSESSASSALSDVSLDRWATAPSESAHWLFGSTAESRKIAGARSASYARRAGPFGPVATAGQHDALESTAFADAGLYVLQWGDRGSADRVSVVFDCGELGFGSLAAHGHADALAIVVRAFGRELLVDPGTYDYFTFPAWRRYFRSTAAHNTVEIDGQDQSEQLGLFLWGRRADARCLAWTPRPGGGSVQGEHDGYRALADPVAHRRLVDLDRALRTLTITDEIVARAPHDVAVHFHFSEECEATRSGNRIAIDLSDGSAELVLDERLSITLDRGGAAPDGGWTSRGYHRKRPAWLLTGRMRIVQSVTLQSILHFARPPNG